MNIREEPLRAQSLHDKPLIVAIVAYPEPQPSNLETFRERILPVMNI